MKIIDLQQSCRILLIANIVFWLLIAFSSLLTGSNHPVVTILLFVEPVLYFVSLVGIRKRIKVIYLFSMVFALGNAILSVTDQMGLADVISLVLSALVFLNLILIWRSIFTENTLPDE